MKVSKYTILKKYDDKVLFFNSLSCAFAIVDNNYLSVIDDINNQCYDESKYDKELIAQMKRTHSIVEDDFDELEYIQFIRNLSKYDTKSLAMTIAPTLDCNFRCVYCFESHIHGVMKSDVQDEIVSFVNKRADSLKEVSICWFGGEPMLSKKVIYELSNRIIDVCQKRGIRYSASIISNASLIDKDTISNFKKYQISSIQITVDGPKDIHDSRRKSLSGKSSFDTIINNAKLLLENEISVSMRINIDNDNVDKINDLLLLLSDQPLFRERLVITFGHVTAQTEVCKSIEPGCLSTEQYANSLIELYNKVLKYGFSKNLMLLYPRVHFNYCTYDYANSFVIDPLGNLYKCWNQIGVEKHKCGSIFDIDGVPSTKFMKCVSWNPIKGECENCKFLPVCMGGCPDLSSQLEENNVCDSIKYNFDNMLDFYYNQLKR